MPDARAVITFLLHIKPAIIPAIMLPIIGCRRCLSCLRHYLDNAPPSSHHCHWLLTPPCPSLPCVIDDIIGLLLFMAQRRCRRYIRSLKSYGCGHLPSISLYRLRRRCFSRAVIWSFYIPRLCWYAFCLLPPIRLMMPYARHFSRFNNFIIRLSLAHHACHYQYLYCHASHRGYDIFFFSHLEMLGCQCRYHINALHCLLLVNVILLTPYIPLFTLLSLRLSFIL